MESDGLVSSMDGLMPACPARSGADLKRRPAPVDLVLS
jgi:hypothetical protein